MTAGLPGVGLGGLFYLFCALLMPVVEIVRTFSGGKRPARWGVVARQWLIACGTLGAIWLTGWALGTFVLRTVAPGVVDEGALVSGTSTAVTAGDVYGVPSAAAGLLTVLLLVIVMVGVQVLRLLVGRRAQHGTSMRARTAEAVPGGLRWYSNDTSMHEQRAA